MADPRSIHSSSNDAAADDWPGKRLGLPASGPRSVARFGRRLAAFGIDITIAALISYAFLGYGRWPSFWTFVVLQVLFLALASGSIGHLLLGMRVVPVAGGWIGPWRPIVRTLLLSIIIPAVIWDRDRRGMHDRAAGTVLVRR
jgi:uncharacterized RDD family membrane protein YckC